MLKAHSPINWQDTPQKATPISAENLNKMDSAIGVIDDRVIELYEKLSGISKFEIKVVEQLPSEEINENAIYLVPSYEDNGNLYSEYIYIDGNWEFLGEQTVDLSGYAKKATTLAGYGITDGITESDMKNYAQPIGNYALNGETSSVWIVTWESGD